MAIDPRAGTRPEPSELLDVGALLKAYYALKPDARVPEQRVSFGTSGHRGSAFATSFNEDHILATTEAICRYRKAQGTDGPLFLAMDTHALSGPAHASALEVLAANGVETRVAAQSGTLEGYTPTPTLSHAVLAYNKGRKTGLADGIVVTPSHNPPADGGFKYNPTNGGPADTTATKWIENEANRLLAGGLAEVRRVPHERALKAATTRGHDFLSAYVEDLGAVVDLDAVAGAGLRLGVDPLGGAGVAYWPRIAERWRFPLEVLNATVDPTFRFMTRDWDGKIRMDCSSRHAMAGLIAHKDRFDVAFACDTDHDRHGIVAGGAGLLNPNHYLSVAIDYVFRNRPGWSGKAGVGKTMVSSGMIDRVAASLGRRLHEVPVGFKWFVDGLLDGSLGFGGEESAGASLLRRDGSVWTTDKDGIALALLAAEMTAREDRDPGELYAALTARHGAPAYERIDAPAMPELKAALLKLAPENLPAKELAGEKIESVLNKAPGNGAALGGVKVSTKSGWFAARPSGTENVYKIYAESFRGEEHLRLIQAQAAALIAGLAGRSSAS
ncbi:MAG: phosphoglucomutase (alpha-D-glucose-1,6-bisphosphate-dependent) [Elusimicrobiota bacterium]